MGRGVFRFIERAADAEAKAALLTEEPQALTAVELKRQEPSMSDRDEVIFLLHTAAEIEHSLLAMYLYAAYSLNTTEGSKQAEWRRTLLTIAREEMAHLLSIQNLLRVLGGPLNFEREDYPFNKFYPFPFQLEPFSLKSIARYVLAEMPEPSAIPASLGFNVEQVKLDAAVTKPGEMVNRVGALFALLTKLVNNLIDQPADPSQRFDFRPEAVKFQAHPDEGWTFDKMILELVHNKAEAKSLVDRIGLQGEGPGDPGGAADSHFRKFFKIYTEIKAALQTNPADAQARIVPINPTTQAPDENESDTNYIAASLARAWADLFNTRYRILLANLAHILTLSVEDPDQREWRGKIFDWIFNEMNPNLATIAETLATSPQHNPPQFKDVGQQKLLLAAGAPFALPYTLQLPDQPIDRWRQHELLLTEAAQRIAVVKAELGGTNTFLDLMSRADDEALVFAREQIRKLSGGVTMPITEIKELRILPPLAIARFGSSPEPMDNYAVKVNEQDAAGFRILEPAETLLVDSVTGEITGTTTPDDVRFRDAAGNIKPTAPFFELWARFDNNDFLEPLTQQHLAGLQLTPASVTWHVRVGNLKLFRRTGVSGDKIEASTGPFTDHAVKQLTGMSEHFKDGKTVPFGSVQYLRPNEAFPEIRLRFTPAAGKVYGHRSGDPNTVDDVYDPNKGRWDDHNDGMSPPGTPPATIPIRIYAVEREGPNQGRNLGYLDDSCDGIIEAQLTVGSQTLSAFARVTVGPPHYAPDSFHPRTVAHEIEQILLGPEVTETIDAERATDLIRRAIDTVRLTNTDFWNVEYGGGTFDPPTANYAHARTRHEAVLADLLKGLKAAPGSVERQRAVGSLTLIHSMLRRHEQVVDLSREVAQLMPALMRGSNGLDVAVTRRELNLIEKAARDFSEIPTPPPPPPPANAFEQDMVRIIGDLSIHANRHMKFVLANGQRLSDLFADPPALLNYLRTEKSRGLGAGPLLDKPLVVPGDPDASAFVGILETPGHPMRAAFQAVDSATGRKRVEIVRDWIRALTP